LEPGVFVYRYSPGSYDFDRIVTLDMQEASYVIAVSLNGERASTIERTFGGQNRFCVYDTRTGERLFSGLGPGLNSSGNDRLLYDGTRYWIFESYDATGTDNLLREFNPATSAYVSSHRIPVFFVDAMAKDGDVLWVFDYGLRRILHVRLEGV
jgi:hypothetical protein